MENVNYKKVWEKILKKYAKEPILKVNSLLELEKDLIELKDREVKIKREIKELFIKPIIVSLDDMNKFNKKKWRQ